MDALYFAMIATIISCVGIPYIFGEALVKVKENVEEKDNIITKTFIKTPLVLFIPIACIVLSFIYLNVTQISYIVPMIVVLGSAVISYYALFMKYKTIANGVEEEKMQSALQLIVNLGYTINFAIPLQAFIIILIAMNK